MEGLSGYQDGDGTRHWIDPDGRLAASLQIPSGPGHFAPLLANVQQIGGLFSGDLSVAGTVRKPSFEGQFVLGDGRMEISPNLPVFSKVSGNLTIASGRVQMENLVGELGGGPFELRGVISLENLSNPS